MAKDDFSAFYQGGSRFVRPQALWTLPFLSFILLNFFIFMGFDLLLPTLSVFLEDMGRNEAEIGRIFSIFTISAVLMRMLATRLACRFEALTLVRLGLLGCVAAGVAYYWAVTASSAMAARFIHGAGYGLASTLITALASQIIPASRLGEGMGYLGLGTTVALAVGPFGGLWLMREMGPFTLFMVVGGVYVASVAIVSLLPKMKLAASVSVASGKVPKPKLVLLSRKVWAPSLMMFLVGIIMSAITIFMALFCKERGLPYAGHFFVLSTIGIFIARTTTGRIHDRFGPQFVVIPSTLLLFLCAGMLHQSFSRDMLLWASVVYGLATGAIFPSLQALAMSMVPISGRTEATASFFNAFDFGMGLGSALLGYLASQSGTYATVFFGAGAASILLLIFYVAYYLATRKRKA